MQNEILPGKRSSTHTNIEKFVCCFDRLLLFFFFEKNSPRPGFESRTTVENGREMRG